MNLKINKNLFFIFSFFVFLLLIFLFFTFFYYLFMNYKTEDEIFRKTADYGDSFYYFNDGESNFYSSIEKSFETIDELSTDLKNSFISNGINYMMPKYIPKDYLLDTAKINYFIDENALSTLRVVEEGKTEKGNYKIYKVNSNYKNNIKNYRFSFYNDNNYISFFFILSPKSFDVKSSPEYTKISLDNKNFENIYLMENDKKLKACLEFEIEKPIDIYSPDFDQDGEMALDTSLHKKFLIIESFGLSKEEFIKVLNNISTFTKS